MEKPSFFKKVYPVLLLTVVVLFSVILLSFANNFTAGKIQEQQDAQAKSMLQVMFPEMTDFTRQDDVYIINIGGSRAGYAFYATGKGYGGNISILVGLADENTVKGISILSQSETAGVGARITLPSFTDRFHNVPINDVKLTADGGQIDGITGSTISSRAVVDAVRETALEKVKGLPK